MTKAFQHISLILLLIGMSEYSYAQAVAIRLEIPPGVNFTSQIVDPMKGGSWEKSKARLWLEIETSENLTVLINTEFPDREILPIPNMEFLNDGSNDFENTKEIKERYQEMRMSSNSRLIRNMNPRPISLKAWLGIPVIDGTIITIEYP